MRTFLVVLSVLSLSVVAQAEETSFHTRLLLHGHKEVGAGFGVAGWVVSPNVSSSPSTWITLAGPRYDGKGWNLEVLAGAITDNGQGKLLLDARLEITPELLGVPIYTWHNLEWIRTGGTGTVYWYSQLDWVVLDGTGLLGGETENSFSAGSKDLSVAPHAVLPLGQHLVLVAAPQFHFGGGGEYTGFQMWFRVVVNL